MESMKDRAAAHKARLVALYAENHALGTLAACRLYSAYAEHMCPVPKSRGCEREPRYEEKVEQVVRVAHQRLGLPDPGEPDDTPVWDAKDLTDALDYLAWRRVDLDASGFDGDVERALQDLLFSVRDTYVPDYTLLPVLDDRRFYESAPALALFESEGV